MRIEAAIEYLNTAQDGFPLNNTEQYYLAIELGKEALKAIRDQREDLLTPDPEMLPGETED